MNLIESMDNPLELETEKTLEKDELFRKEIQLVEEEPSVEISEAELEEKLDSKSLQPFCLLLQSFFSQKYKSLAETVFKSIQTEAL